MKIKLFFGFMAFIVLTGSCIGQQTVPSGKDQECEKLQSRFHSLNKQINQASPLTKRDYLLHFLKTVPDDPANCVTRAAEEELQEIEKQLIRLKIHDQFFIPDWIFQCYRIDRRTQKCEGSLPYADDIPMIGEAIVPPHLHISLLEKTPDVVITPGVGCKIITLSVLDFQTRHHGYPPIIIARNQSTFPTDALKRIRYPVLIASIRCNDTLSTTSKYRKVAWIINKGTTSQFWP